MNHFDFFLPLFLGLLGIEVFSRKLKKYINLYTHFSTTLSNFSITWNSPNLLDKNLGPYLCTYPQVPASSNPYNDNFLDMVWNWGFRSSQILGLKPASNEDLDKTCHCSPYSCLRDPLGTVPYDLCHRLSPHFSKFKTGFWLSLSIEAKLSPNLVSEEWAQKH